MATQQQNNPNQGKNPNPTQGKTAEQIRQEQKRQEQERDQNLGGANKRPGNRSEEIDEEEDPISSFGEKQNQANRNPRRDQQSPNQNQNQNRP